MLRVAATGVASLVALPVAALAILAAQGSGALWPHLAGYVLPDALQQTLVLLLGVGVVAGALGTGAAWLVAWHDFPGRGVLSWALLLPLAVPTYISAYAWLDLLHPAGPVQAALRTLWGGSGHGPLLPDLRSTGGCVLLLGGVLYPYVYLNVRIALASQGAELMNAARSLGASGSMLLWRVGLPMARPAIAVGISLALLEALNDIGASEFLGVRTLTVAISVTWLTRSSLEGAAQLALALLLLVAGVMALERWGRRAAAAAPGSRPPAPVRLRGLPGAAATLACAVPVGLGFAAPAAHLAWSSWTRVAAHGLPAELAAWTGASALLAALAAAATLLGALLVAFCARIGHGRFPLLLAMLGYAMPGGVIAVGLVVALGGVDTLLQATWPLAAAPVLSGSVAAVVLAYLVRFLAIPVGAVDAAYATLGREMDICARSLGARSFTLFARIHLPLLAPALPAAALLVFIDAMKELPATLLLRPLNLETLATALYGEAVRGTYEDGAVAALAIVAAGLVPVVLLARVARFRPPAAPVRARGRPSAVPGTVPVPALRAASPPR
ncbi:Ferric iron ABC transporter, permease protein [Rhodovastum atsumiense]|uniref:Iron ABC transporter permease n=1 Tax=Rhodovastum atsumiense TaxID=504468 RepID=A0A5M6IVG7_9PROT|nr:iron ABC transporter permease [Rhodovastum atsumiense]KAA5612304.1 iron ABC transporter permease [Rhodovastum atsumiense]CAH2601633.1 Ferric iron ABC transporter, permease protein [Rhodovastum atsumiense]